MKTSLIAITCFILCSFASINDLPQNWFKAGSNPKFYDMGMDNNVKKSGVSSAYIFSNKNKINGFGTMMQSCSAENYLGKRIRLSGYIKSENVEDWSGMWLRIDGCSDKNLGFDNMEDRAIKGTTDWTRCEIVLDVPRESKSLNFGVLLSGTGKVWFDDFKVEVVDESIKTSKGAVLLKQPSNLSFED